MKTNIIWFLITFALKETKADYLMGSKSGLKSMQFLQFITVVLGSNHMNAVYTFQCSQLCLYTPCIVSNIINKKWKESGEI